MSASVYSIEIYRKDTEVRAILRGGAPDGNGPLKVSFSAGRTVSFRKCAERALAQVGEIGLSPHLTYRGERVSEWPAQCATR